MSELKANFFDCLQESPEWLALRCGRVTSSRVAEAIAFLKRRSNGKEVGEETQARADYKLELAWERITGVASDHYVSRWMKEGKEKEPLAVTAYEAETGAIAEKIGFVIHPEINWCGASPDSLIGADGLAEYKCPRKETHQEYLWCDEIPEQYEPQMMWQMACDPERQWNDFVSFHPKLPKRYRVFIKRLYRDNNRIAEMEDKVKKFLAEVAEIEEDLRERFGNGPSRIETVLRESIAEEVIP